MGDRTQDHASQWEIGVGSCFAMGCFMLRMGGVLRNRRGVYWGRDHARGTGRAISLYIPAHEILVRIRDSQGPS